jgi:hypothetical protein
MKLDNTDMLGKQCRKETEKTTKGRKKAEKKVG